MKQKIFFSVLVFHFLMFLDAAGQSKKPMTVIDFLNIPSINNGTISNNGKEFVYVLSTSDWKENKQISHVWRKNLVTNELIQLTNSPKGESNPVLSPDGKSVLFTSKRDGMSETQAFLLNNSGGEAKQFTKHKTSVKNVKWFQSGNGIYFLANNPKTKEEEKKEKLKDDVYAFDEDYKHVHLWQMQINDTIAKRITEGEFTVGNYEISRDGKLIVFNKAINPLLGDSNLSEIWLMDQEGKNQRQLTNNKISENNLRISPDNKQILFLASTNEKFEQHYNSNLFLISVKGGEVILPIPDNKFEVNEAEWSKDGKSIFLLMNTGVESQLFTYNLATKKLSQITFGKHNISYWSYNDILNQHVIGINDYKNAGDFYTMKGDDFKTIKKVTNVYDYLDNQFLLPRQEMVSWKGEDGVTVEGIVNFPIDFKEGTKYPLVVQTHGGPATSDQYGLSLRYTHYHPVLAAKGYMILQPNYRGSTGYGNLFFRDMVGGYFNNAHVDVMKGVDFLIEKGWVDSDKMVKMGWSAGGHMTNKLITFTDRFKAASSGAGAVNWISMYGQSDVRKNRTPWFGGTPWQENAPIDVYWNNSPLKDIYKAKTPTLIFVGANDVRVPSSQSVELYRALRYLEVPTHLYMAPREPHGWGELRHRNYKINAELEWFSKYALNKEYVWENAPSEK